jgi:DNA-binding FrmR family transcriptional regulator
VPEERDDMQDEHFRARIEARVDALERRLERQDAKLDEVLQLLHASKLGLAALKGLIMLGVAIVGAWAAMRGVR